MNTEITLYLIANLEKFIGKRISKVHYITFCRSCRNYGEVSFEIKTSKKKEIYKLGFEIKRDATGKNGIEFFSDTLINGICPKCFNKMKAVTSLRIRSKIEESLDIIVKEAPIVPYTFYKDNNQMVLQIGVEKIKFKDSKRVISKIHMIIDEIVAGFLKKDRILHSELLSNGDITKLIKSLFPREIYLLRILKLIVQNNFYNSSKKLLDFEDYVSLWCYIYNIDYEKALHDINTRGMLLNPELTTAIGLREKLLDWAKEKGFEVREGVILRRENDYFTDGVSRWKRDYIELYKRVFPRMVKVCKLVDMDSKDFSLLLLYDKIAGIIIAPIV